MFIFIDKIYIWDTFLDINDITSDVCLNRQTLNSEIRFKMATGGVTDQVGGRRGHLCDPCNRAGRRTLATVLCKTCDGHLCTDCCVKHLASAIGQHKIFNIGEQNEEEVTADDVQHSSDFVDTIRNTRDITRSATLKHLVTLDLVKTDGDDELPFVTGMDFLPDGRLVAVDYRNKRCIVLDDNLRRKGLHTFETVPLDLTCYGGDKLAVTCRYVQYTHHIA